MALGRGGSFTTIQPSLHTLTNIAVIEKFLPVEIAVENLGAARHRITVTE
jgi:RNA 3'-terminal phosphate cyclase (ATP)